MTPAEFIVAWGQKNYFPVTASFALNSNDLLIEHETEVAAVPRVQLRLPYHEIIAAGGGKGDRERFLGRVMKTFQGAALETKRKALGLPDE